MILFILPKFINSGIILSQHVIVAKKMSKNVTVHIAIHNKFKKDLPRGFLSSNQIIWYNSYFDLWGRLNNYSWVYIRSHYTFFPVFLKKIISFNSFKIFYDFRALSYIEVYYVQKSRLKQFLFFIMEYLCYHLSNARGAVSNKIADKLKSAFGSKSVYIMPCCIDSVKSELELYNIKSQNNSSSIKMVYVGSINKWQCFEETIGVFREIVKQRSAHLTVITFDIDKANTVIRNSNLCDISTVDIFSLSHSEVMDMLPQFDFGFLIREDSPINNFASPVKFLEYTSNGVIPIMTPGIGDYSEIIKEGGTGIILSKDLEIDLKELDLKYKNKEIISELISFSKAYTFDTYLANHPLLNS